MPIISFPTGCYVGNTLLTDSTGGIISSNFLNYSTPSIALASYADASLVSSGSIKPIVTDLTTRVSTLETTVAAIQSGNSSGTSSLIMNKTSVPNTYALMANIDNKTFTILTAHYLP